MDTPSPATALAPDSLVASATLVIFRQNTGPEPEMPSESRPEILMVERAGSMRFAAHAAVFPGGRVDRADRALAQTLLPTLGAGAHGLDETAARIAAIRETLEETGLALGFDRQLSAGQAAEARRHLQEQGALAPVLAHFGLRLDLAALVPYARWRQPDVGGFDTRFYLADLGSGAVDIAVDGTENTRAFWIRAQDALAAADAGKIRVIFPTRRNLERLAQHASFAQARAHASAFPMPAITAKRAIREGVEYLTIPEGLGYPVTDEPVTQARRG